MFKYLNGTNGTYGLFEFYQNKILGSSHKKLKGYFGFAEWNKTKRRVQTVNIQIIEHHSLY